MLRYAFGALGMRRVGLTHPDPTEASLRIAEKLGFVLCRSSPVSLPVAGRPFCRQIPLLAI